MCTKNKIIYILEKHRQNAISGQEIADQLQISRAAVWKIIQALQEEGYPIITIARKGYCLADNCDILSAGGIQCYLHEEYLDSPIYVYEEVDSTNTRMKELASQGAVHHSIITANSQTQGKGRYGRHFYSPKNAGMYMTLLLREQKAIQDATIITMIAGVAVCHIIERHSKQKPSIKWVNDIYCNQHKIVGILSEAIIDFESGMSEAIILGIGLNLNTEQFPEELHGIATALYDADCSRNQWVAEIANEVFSMYEKQDIKTILEEYRAYSCVLHKDVNFIWNKEWHTGYVKDINDQGNLIIIENGIEHVLTSGEISIKL